MNRTLCFFALAALLPALSGAQEQKYVNCRTLAAAGNFIGSDETLVNNMVCQVVKGDAANDTKAKKESRDGHEPLPGESASVNESSSVADAARTEEKKPMAGATHPVEKPTNALAATTSPTAGTAEPATAPVGAPTVEAKPEDVATTTPLVSKVAAAPEATHDTAASAPAATSAQPESVAVSSAPAMEASAKAASAAEPAESDKPAPDEAAVASVAAAPRLASTAPPAAPIATPTSREAAAPATEKGTGFYDANSTTKVATVGPPTHNEKSSNVAAEPVNPPVEEAPAAAADAPAAPAAALPQQDDPNAERERVVQLGAFAGPKEATPGSEAERHTTSFEATEDEAFREGQKPDCTKNITLGSLKGDTLVLGTPAWAAKWIGKNQKRAPQMCFSGMPMAGARNYLIVFYTMASATKLGEAHIAGAGSEQEGTPASGYGSFTTSYGATWHYAYDRVVGVTINSRSDADQPHSQPGQLQYATAYTEEGMPVAQHWPGQPKKHVDEKSKNAKKNRSALEAKEQVSGELLNEMVRDIDKL